MLTETDFKDLSLTIEDEKKIMEAIRELNNMSKNEYMKFIIDSLEEEFEE